MNAQSPPPAAAPVDIQSEIDALPTPSERKAFIVDAALRGDIWWIEAEALILANGLGAA